MKKIVLLSHESVFSGVVRTGLAEVVDSLANTLSIDYEVFIICCDGNGVFARTATDLMDSGNGVRTCKFSKVNYYLVKPAFWRKRCLALIKEIKPDVLHNFAEPELIRTLHPKPAKLIYTFDCAEYVRGKEEFLYDYHCVTTVSEHYSNEVLSVNDDLAITLRSLDYHGVTNGILNAAFSPEKGLMLPAKYSSTNQSGKETCRQRLKKMYGIMGDPFVCLMMGRIEKEKGIEDVLSVVHDIRNNGGILVVVGTGNREYEKKLHTLTRDDGVIYINKWASPVQAAPLMAGADFLIYPSTYEPCGLMPMTASKYGTVPIVTQVGGLVDNFNDDNAIIVGNDGLAEAISRAAELYSDKSALLAKRKICMEQDFSWKTRKAGYITLYEKAVDAE